MKLSSKKYEAAVSFIETNARELDRRLFDYHFHGGTAVSVINALTEYQNNDGGFGHAIEPDFRLTASSPMATSVGLQYCLDVGAAPDHPIVKSAINYLIATYDSKHNYWPATYQNVNDEPHAPWWHVNEVTPPDDTGWPNPSAELLGYLHWASTQVPPTLLRSVTNRALMNLDSSSLISGDSPQKYNLLCWERALPYLPEPMATAVAQKIRHTYTAWQPLTVEQLNELSITMILGSPEAILAQVYPHEVKKLVTAETENQADDGGWWPTWSWGQYEEVWPVAKREWAGKITIATLLALKNFELISEI